MSDTNKSRRSFLSKITLAGAGLALTPQSVLANNSTQNQLSVIKQIRALGFQWQTLDPFLFCVHHEDFFPKGNGKCGPIGGLEGRNLGQDFLIKDGWRMYHGRKVPGFPGHPHRGFETITVVRKGLVDHSDSMGAAGRYGNGDVQWMTAGRGLQHAEMFPLLKDDADNPLELFQIWINLPKKNKMVDPHFKMLWNEDIPKINEKDATGKRTLVEVIAGKYQTHSAPTPPPSSWAADAAHYVSILNIKMEANASFTLPKAIAGLNRTAYYYKGSGLTLAGKTIPNYHAIDLDASMDAQFTAGNDGAGILILQGKPINEPVVQHGPFVMNTKEEIQQAFYDYQQTYFGGWPWPEAEVVHPKNMGRFAFHADGRREVKG